MHNFKYSSAKSFMINNYSDYLEFDSMNYTKLAEATAYQLNIYDEDDFTIPEWVYDLAVDIESELLLRVE